MRINIYRPKSDVFCGTVSFDMSLIKEAILSIVEKEIEKELERRFKRSISRENFSIPVLQDQSELSSVRSVPALFKFDDTVLYNETDEEPGIPYFGFLFNHPDLDLWNELDEVRKLLKLYRKQIRKCISGQLHRLWILRMKNSKRSTTPQISDKMILTIPTPPTMNIITYGIPMWGMAYGKVL